MRDLEFDTEAEALKFEQLMWERMLVIYEARGFTTDGDKVIGKDYKGQDAPTKAGTTRWAEPLETVDGKWRIPHPEKSRFLDKRKKESAKIIDNVMKSYTGKIVERKPGDIKDPDATVAKGK